MLQKFKTRQQCHQPGQGQHNLEASTGFSLKIYLSIAIDRPATGMQDDKKNHAFCLFSLFIFYSFTFE